MARGFGFRRKSNSGEEGAGWIYADLFLALMIVGLGSAVVTTSPASGSAPAQKTFQLSCAEFAVRVPGNIRGGGAAIESAVSAEIAKRGWSPDSSKPGLVIVMGGFSGSESPGAGDNRAQGILPQLRASTPLLQQVEMRTAGARSVRVNGVATTVGGTGSYLMVTYLLFSGPQLQEDCTR
ncbi:MAG: hypothetical protein LW686_05575 [Ilumatobacteraceae bacterium]|nr:hypothetical protein [Ilumatobacteraceae bacterium]